MNIFTKLRKKYAPVIIYVLTSAILLYFSYVHGTFTGILATIVVLLVGLVLWILYQLGNFRINK